MEKKKKEDKYYLPRDISWMYFNRRILQEAMKERVPILERLSFLGIYSNNLDEFFRVRVATQSRVAECEDKAAHSEREEALKLIRQINKLNNRYSKEYEGAIKQVTAELEKENICLVNHVQLDEEQQLFVDSFYQQRLNGFISPVWLKSVKQLGNEADENIFLAVKRNLADSREKAKAYIMAGNVYVDGQKEDKAGTMFQETVKIEVRGNTLPYVSRGGLKLEKAMNHFGVELDGRVCMDVGASTGGFTDCMLQNGAVKVYSIDVGYGQLDWKLRNDPRVVCMEKTNIRYVIPEDIQEPAQFSSIDVSFISLTKVLLPVRNLLTEDGEIVCLIKPQFEAGREKVGKKGVVRDPAVHLEVIEKVIAYASSIALEPRHLSFSPIKGPEGNIEYLLHLKKRPEGEVIESSLEAEPEQVVREAHDQLD